MLERDPAFDVGVAVLAAALRDPPEMVDRPHERGQIAHRRLDRPALPRGRHRVPVEVRHREPLLPSQELPDVEIAVDPHRERAGQLVEGIEIGPGAVGDRAEPVTFRPVRERERLVERGLGTGAPRRERRRTHDVDRLGQHRRRRRERGVQTARDGADLTGGRQGGVLIRLAVEPRRAAAPGTRPSRRARRAGRPRRSRSGPSSPSSSVHVTAPIGVGIRSNPASARCTGSSSPGWGPGAVNGYSFTTTRSPTTTDSFDWSTSIARSPRNAEVPPSAGRANRRNPKRPNGSPSMISDRRPSNTPSPAAARRTSPWPGTSGATTTSSPDRRIDTT